MRVGLFLGFKSVRNKVKWVMKLIPLLLLGTQIMKLVNHLIQPWRYNSNLWKVYHQTLPFFK